MVLAVVETTRVCRLLLPLFLTLVIYGRAAEGTVKFEQAKASSTQGPEFEAAQALQPGPSYWCSAGQHTDDEQVTWSATLEAPTLLRGLRIGWAYSPELVQLSVSADGRNWTVASPFKRTPSSDVAFNEDIFFDHPRTVKAVSIAMRKSLHDYFGMSLVEPLETGEPQLMIVSGITSKDGEMCLQVEGGAFNKDGAHVVLDTCTNAIAAGDGREIWVQNANRQIVAMRSQPKKCIILQDGKVEGGGAVVLGNCLAALEEGDGRSTWTPEPNSQLRLDRAGFYCLTQQNSHGTEPGTGDIAVAFGAAAQSGSSAGAAHSPAMALDRDVSTFWASGAFPDAEEHPVALDIDLGKSARLAALRLDWEYPPMAYKVQVSQDGKTFTDAAENVANPANVTLDTLPGPVAQHVRILMTHPHTTNGKVGDQYVYGIREVYALASRLDSAVGDCKEAANSEDARDKYFLLPVHEFDSEIAAKMDSLEEDVLRRSRTLGKKTKLAADSLDRAKNCVAEKEKLKTQTQALAATAATLQGELLKLSFKTQGRDERELGYLPGDSPNYPAEDCFAAKAASPEAPSGFYWILPRCAPHPLRVYCAMESATSLLFVKLGVGDETTNVPKVHSLTSLRLRCAEKGLEPFVLQSAGHLRALQLALKQIGLDEVENAVLPLAHDMGCLEGKCTGAYKDLFSGTTDLTSLLLEGSTSSHANPKALPTAGLRLPGAEPTYFDIETANVAVIVCSTNAGEGQVALPHIDIGCEASAASHPAFFGITNTNIVVECPPGCSEASSLPVFGTNGLYSDLSAICKAAVHAGVLKGSNGGLASVSLESSLPSYEGSTSNGVKSEALNTPNTIQLTNELKTDLQQQHQQQQQNGGGLPSKRRGRVTRSVRIVPVAKDCPIESLSSLSSSFIELAVSTTAGAAVSETPNEKAEDVMIDPMMAAVINDVLGALDQVHGLDPTNVFAAQTAAAEATAALEEALMPAALLQQQVLSSTGDLLQQAEGAATALLNSSGAVGADLDALIYELGKVEKQRRSQTGFQSFSLNYTRDAFSDVFETADSYRATGGPSSWGYAEVQLNEHTNQKHTNKKHTKTIGQSAPVKGRRPTEGTFAFLKGRRFYDGVIHVDFFPFDKGTVGVAFRMQDLQNLFLLSASNEPHQLLLHRVEDGEAFLLQQTESPQCYTENSWNRLRIELHHGRIKVAVGEGEKHWRPALDMFDEGFLSGTAGLFVSGVKRGVLFDNFRVDAAPCSPISKGLQLRQGSSSRFRSSSSSSSQQHQFRWGLPAPLRTKAAAKRRTSRQKFSEAAAPWKSCVEAVHPLQRQHECSLMESRNPKRAKICAEDFCSHCCSNSTLLLEAPEKYKCLKRCKQNQAHAEELHIHLSKLIEECTDTQGAGFGHCEQRDSACAREACAFCCQSSEKGEELKGPLGLHFRRNKLREVQECQASCQQLGQQKETWISATK